MFGLKKKKAPKEYCISINFLFEGEGDEQSIKEAVIKEFAEGTRKIKPQQIKLTEIK